MWDVTDWEALFELAIDWQETGYSGPSDLYEDNEVNELDVLEMIRRWHD